MWQQLTTPPLSCSLLEPQASCRLLPFEVLLRLFWPCCVAALRAEGRGQARPDVWPPAEPNWTMPFLAGEPKAIPWSHTTPLRCAANAFFHQDVRRGDVVCWPTNMGWMLGPWLVFGGERAHPRAGSVQGRPGGLSSTARQLTLFFLATRAPRSTAERRINSAAKRQPAGPAVWRVCAGCPHHHAGCGALHCQGGSVHDSWAWGAAACF